MIEMDERIPFSCFVEETPAGVTVALTGELDLASAVDFEKTVDEVLGAGPEAVMVDLESLSFMDSSGLLALLRLEEAARKQGATLTFARPTEAVRRIFDLAGAHERLRILEDP